MGCQDAILPRVRGGRELFAWVGGVGVSERRTCDFSLEVERVEGWVRVGDRATIPVAGGFPQASVPLGDRGAILPKRVAYAIDCRGGGCRNPRSGMGEGLAVAGLLASHRVVAKTEGRSYPVWKSPPISVKTREIVGSESALLGVAVGDRPATEDSPSHPRRDRDFCGVAVQRTADWDASGTSDADCQTSTYLAI